MWKKSSSFYRAQTTFLFGANQPTLAAQSLASNPKRKGKVFLAAMAFKAATGLLLLFLGASGGNARRASEVVRVPGWEAKGFPLSFAIKAAWFCLGHVFFFMFSLIKRAFRTLSF